MGLRGRWLGLACAACVLVLGGAAGCGDDDALDGGGLLDGALEGGTRLQDGGVAPPRPIPPAGRDSGTDAGPTGEAGLPPADAGCDNSLDCAESATGSVCHGVLRRCVECSAAADCGESADCVDHECESFTPCENSLDCELGQVCDATRARCVECVANPDCGMEEICVRNACRRTCDSDNDCTPFGLLCDRGGGHCVECLVSNDCTEDRHCSLGRCAADECEPRSALCSPAGDAVVACAEDGSSLLPAVTCAARQTCSDASGVARCEDWACTAGTTECVQDALVVCSDDGLEIEERTDCAGDDRVCAAGECRTLQCMPSSRFCDGNTLRQCSVDGLSSVGLGACGVGTYCDDDAAGCAVGVCSPNEPACNTTFATTCNATGSGFEAGGDDCSADSHVCVNGACEPVICTPNELSCEDGDAVRCSSTGTRELVEQVCTPDQFCDLGLCQARACEPAALFCLGSEVRRCNALGSAHELEVACTSTQTCDAERAECVDDPPLPDGGTCEPIGCTCSIPAYEPCCDTLGRCSCAVVFTSLCNTPGASSGGACTCQ